MSLPKIPLLALGTLFIAMWITQGCHRAGTAATVNHGNEVLAISGDSTDWVGRYPNMDTAKGGTATPLYVFLQFRSNGTGTSGLSKSSTGGFDAADFTWTSSPDSDGIQIKGSDLLSGLKAIQADSLVKPTRFVASVTTPDSVVYSDTFTVENF